MNLLIEVPFLSIGLAMATFAIYVKCASRVRVKS